MKLDIKTPAKIDHWRASDGKTFDCEERARTHEVFLAVSPCIPKDAGSRYDVINQLARKFDFVPRGGAESA
jgi:hypothetical protein